MIVGGYRSRTGFWEMALAAFIGTVAGTLAVRLAEGEQLPDACRAANAAAAKSVAVRYVLPSIPYRVAVSGNLV